MLVLLPSVLLMLLSVARAVGPGSAVQASVWAPALAVLLPSVLLMLPSVARATGPGPVALASVWAPAPVLSAARTVELQPSVLVAAWASALAILLPVVPVLCPRRARFPPMGRRFAERSVAPSRCGARKLSQQLTISRPIAPPTRSLSSSHHLFCRPTESSRRYQKRSDKAVMWLRPAQNRDRPRSAR